MTITATSSVISYNGDGTSTAFPFPYEFLDASHLVVNLVDIASGAVTPQTLGANYTVSGAGNPDGGAVTMLVAPPSGAQLKIQRIVPLVQLIDLEAGDTFPADTMEGALDYLTMACQQISDLYSGASLPPSGGGANTFLNLGAGHGVYLQTIGSQVQLRGLVAGSNVTITHNATDITIAAAGVAGALLAANNLSDVASRQAALNTLTAAAGGGNEFVLTRDTASGNAVWKVVPTGGAGEANTMSSSGAGASIVQAKAGVNLPVRSFVAGANVTIVQNANDLTISAATAGEANTGQNIGIAGTGIFAGKSGLNLQFKGLAGGLGISIANNATDITPAINPAASIVWTGAETFQTGGPLALSPDFGAFQTAPNPIYCTRIDAGTRNDARVGTALLVNAKVAGGGSGNFAEWAALFCIEDHSNGSTGNVPFYAKGNKYGTGAMWGSVLECTNFGGALTGNMYGVEIDCVSDGDPGPPHPFFPGGHHGAAIFYGAYTNNSAPGPSSKQTNGLLIAPFYGGRDNLYCGVAVRGGGTVAGPSFVDNAFLTDAKGLAAFYAAGQYSIAAVDLSNVTNTSVALDMAGGARLKFRSSAAAGPAYWFPGAFAPAFVGAIAILVDATTLYIPICSNHP